MNLQIRILIHWIKAAVRGLFSDRIPMCSSSIVVGLGLLFGLFTYCFVDHCYEIL